MAEITVDWYDGTTPLGKVKITPRNNGYEWTKTDSRGKLITKEYCSTFTRKDLTLFIRNNNSAFFRGMFIQPSDFSPTSFKKADALKIYDFFIEQMEWSPDALASGTAHPDLLAAQQRHTATVTPSAGGGGGGSRRKRKTRKSRKSRK